jgi:hypothetical protein
MFQSRRKIVSPRWKVCFAAALILAPGAAAMATDANPPRPELFDKLVACRAISEADKRLSCYDTQVTALDAAEKKQDLVVMDRAQVKETRRSLFGFVLPKLTLGGKKLDDADEISEIETTILSARRSGYDWVLLMSDNNGTWQTSDPLTRTLPKAGVHVRIRKAAIGSFLARIGDNQGIRLRRIG